MDDGLSLDQWEQQEEVPERVVDALGIAP